MTHRRRPKAGKGRDITWLSSHRARVTGRFRLMATTGVLSRGSLAIISPQTAQSEGAHGHHGGSGSMSSSPPRVASTASTLPTVRCATCGRQLALDQLTGHSCIPNNRSRSPPSASPPAPLPNSSPPPSPVPVPARSHHPHSPSPNLPVMMTHPRTLIPGDPRPMMAPSLQNQFMEKNQNHRLPGRIILQQPQQTPWVPPMQHQPMPQRQAQLPPSSTAVQLDTKIGGEAGMAGVGRRGFAMAAAAAVFASSAARSYSNHTPVPIDPRRRFNAPQYFDSSGDAGDGGLSASSLRND